MTADVVSIQALSAASAGLQIATDALIAGSLYWLNRKRASDHESVTSLSRLYQESVIVTIIFFTLYSRNVFSQAFVSALNRGVFSACVAIPNRLRFVWLTSYPGCFNFLLRSW